MTRTLDPRFAAILAAAAGQGWIARALARDEVEAVALRSGFTFAEALREIGRVPGAPKAPADGAICGHAEPVPAPVYPSTKAIPGLGPARAAQILAALRVEPGRSDRAVARELRCSPTLVGRARAAAGLASATREVRRGGSAYRMSLSRPTPPQGQNAAFQP